MIRYGVLNIARVNCVEKFILASALTKGKFAIGMQSEIWGMNINNWKASVAGPSRRTGAYLHSITFM